MGRMATMCAIIAIGSNLWAQSVNLTGKVTNQSGKAIAGAIVILKSKNLSDTTDATGAYSIAAAVSSVNNTSILPSFGDISMNNGIVGVHITQQSRMLVELFDIKGRQLYSVAENSAKTGDYQFNLGNSPFVAAMMVVRVTIGQHVSNFRYIPSCINSGASAISMSSSPRNMLAKIEAATDSLQASALSYKTKTVAISSYTATTDFILESTFTGTCTASKQVSISNGIKGSGPHKVVMETNSDAGIKEGTIYRPEDLAPGKNYPILIWGQGACSRDGRGAEASNVEIASYGYVVIADGTPQGGGALAMNLNAITPVARAYAKWIIAENRKPCSAYYQSVDTTKVASNGFSCGGLFGMALAGDPYIATWGVSSSGCLNGNGCPETWNVTHTPVIIIEGNSGDPGYGNGLRDFNGIAALKKWPVYFISNRKMGHGGDLWNANGGDFTKIHLSWLNWWIKGDTTATTGKGVLVGSTCKYCTNSDWEIKTDNIK
ncbi:MAG TPA: hypothetical protein VHO70_00520 [Chitinispirillaceae bacterium]|nr:hypothetical protein [Chitinispirillaceae bacterium]